MAVYPCGDSLTASLYVHVPFCAGKCDYCDFYSVPADPDDYRMSVYVDKILEDCQLIRQKYHIEKIPSVYIGGGTPSYLGSSLVNRLVRGIREIFVITGQGESKQPEHNAEITLEVNPESCDEFLLMTAKEAGVTRLSLGVQSFCDASRKAVNRRGEGRLIPEKLELASKIFPGNFSADLISGLPFQTTKILMNDIENLLIHKPVHISLYTLTIEPGTPLAFKKSANPAGFPSPDRADKLWITGKNILEKSGFHQYEVSNFCVAGKESIHNQRYWRMENWFGLGPAASGTLINDEAGTGQRFTNTADINTWLDRKPGISPAGAYEILDKKTLMMETILMGFRLAQGPDTELFRQRFKINMEDLLGHTLEKWRNLGLFRQDRTALTGEGLLLLDRFLIEAFAEMDSNPG